MLIFERITGFLLAALAFVGIFMQAGLHQGRYKLGTFSYYTNLSNLFTGIYQLLLFIGSFVGGALYDALTGAALRYSLTLMIWVTHLVLCRTSRSGRGSPSPRSGGALTT